MATLKNKVTVITGASSGIGMAAAIEFARKGSKVVMAARREDKLVQLEKHIRQFNENCIFVKTDVTDEEQVKNLFDEAEKEFGQIDILINNAGRGLKSELINISLEDWNAVLAVNLTAVFLCSKEAALRMKNKNVRGHIITISSIAGKISTPFFSAYCASKRGVRGFKKAIKWELKKYKIKVSNVHPFVVMTEFFEIYPQKPPRNQALMPEDIATHLAAIAERKVIKRLWTTIRNFLKRLFNLIWYSLFK